MATFALAAAACDSCGSCGSEPLPDVGPPKVVDTGASVEDEPEDPLKEAREQAESEAESVAVHISDLSRAVGAEIEAQANKPKPKPRPKLKNEPETGRLSKAQLNKVFNIHAGAMKKCYERSLKKSPGLQGKVRLEVLISTSGDTKTARVRGLSLNDASVHGCMERQALTMKFPEPDGGAVRVNKTYSFFPDL